MIRVRAGQRVTVFRGQSNGINGVAGIDVGRIDGCVFSGPRALRTADRSAATSRDLLAFIPTAAPVQLRAGDKLNVQGDGAQYRVISRDSTDLNAISGRSAGWTVWRVEATS